MTNIRAHAGRRDLSSAHAASLSVSSLLRVALATVALSALSSLAACGGSGGGGVTLPIDTTTTPPPITWNLVWSDEFDGTAGTSVDPAKWGFDLGDGCAAGICGWGNNEKEYYTNATDNVSLDGQGHLAIVARSSPALSVSCFYGPCQYTSAKITTRGKMNAAPGRVEARIKIPAGQGLWPAFWMLGNDFATLGWPAAGELDIMENKGSAPNTSSSAIHGPGYSGNTPFAHANTIGPGTLADNYHVYAVEWDAENARFYVDGTMHYSVLRGDIQRYGTSILNKPYYVMLNLAVGGNFDGDPGSATIFPATMLVDYVRVYTKAQ